MELLRTIVFGICSELVLTSVLMFSFSVTSGFSELLVHNIDTGLDYGTIQEAIDANETLNGQTIFVEEGIYRENVVVSKSLSLIGEKTENTIIDGMRMDDVVHVKADNVTIARFTIRNSSRRFYVSGIRIDASDHCNVTGNRLIDNMYGVMISHGFETAIIRNDVIDNFWIGISLNESFSNTISENQIVANTGGIELEASTGNSIRKNNIVNNTVGGIRQTNSPYNKIYWNNITTHSFRNSFGIWLSDSSNSNISRNTFENCGMILWKISVNNTVENNVVNRKPLVYIEGVSNRTIQEAGQVIAINCNEICVENLDLSWATVGVELWGTNNSEIANNSILKNSFCGVILEESHGNSIWRNNITENNQAIDLGWFHCSSNGNTISENNIVSNKYGIYLGFSSNNNTIAGNKIAESLWDGIYIYSSCFNLISMNSLYGNTPGLYFTDASNNLVFANNFMNNSAQAYIIDSANAWDNGYEGNYWLDYEERYPDAVSDMYGIWDTPYVISGDNFDRYPLVTVYWNPGDINHDLNVNISDITIAAEAFGSFPGFPNWNCHADITGSRHLFLDEKVDIRDIALIAINCGEIYS